MELRRALKRNRTRQGRPTQATIMQKITGRRKRAGRVH
ncbi:Uncharacterised protein [Bordetella pertussis]|nr:Uncharacterised protein [Bordetella pertussis]CFW19953.1 Uncharacterised protein [Bordetella pertussis]CPK78793.1 Uncharacterised protein [Bordetella pertussis]